MHEILTFIKQLADVCHEAIHHRFVLWTKPAITSLMLGTLIDLARSKTELMAENALQRKPLVILRRQVKRPSFARMAATSGIKILKTPYHAKRPNAICERFLGSVRHECLDHLLILQEKQLHRVLRASIQYFNQARPHQGIRQQIPDRSGEPVSLDHQRGKILSLPVLDGLNHDYREIRLTSEGACKQVEGSKRRRMLQQRSRKPSVCFPVFLT